MVFLMNIFLYLCVGGKCLFIKQRKKFTDISMLHLRVFCYLFHCFLVCNLIFRYVLVALDAYHSNHSNFQTFALLTKNKEHTNNYRKKLEAPSN